MNAVLYGINIMLLQKSTHGIDEVFKDLLHCHFVAEVFTLYYPSSEKSLSLGTRSGESPH